MSYVAKSREIAQWLVAKAEDVVGIRGIEYKLLFKPWMARAELEERRKQEDETKFWVTALRGPLRAMFHVPDLVQQVMGNIILQHPPEPDASRPKLMNLKFELPREAEERFEPTLPMKLVDGEIYNVEFVCKNTPWCTRCRWWFHTESDGCPRADEEVEGRDFQGAVAGRSRGRGFNQNFNQGEVVYQRGIRDAARDVASVQDGGERLSRVGGVSGNASGQQPSLSVRRDQGQNSAVGGSGGQGLGGGSIGAVGLTCIPLRVLLEDSSTELSNVLVEPGVAAKFLKTLNERMPLDKNLDLGFVQEVLAEKWQSTSPATANANQDRVTTERIQDPHALIAPMVKLKLATWNVKGLGDSGGKRKGKKPKCEGVSFVVATVYAPNDPRDRMHFMKAIPYCLPQEEHMVVGGDWNLMRELQHPHRLGEPVATSNEMMCEYAADYFKDILATRKTYWDWETDLTKESDFWDTLQVRVAVHDRLLLDIPISAEELRQTLKSMAKGKAPSNDGLPVEFFNTCWQALVADLVKLCNDILVGGTLGKTMTKGVISLMYKKGDRSEILAKTLARRLGPILPGLVGSDQGAFVRGRSSFDNILTAIESLKIIEEENLDVAALMIDLEKAYDRVNWTFVMTTLKVLGFGSMFCRWVKVLYAFSTATVQMNGVISEPFQLSRSLRQGCPLAPLLFVLQLETLLSAIRVNHGIRGLQLPGGGECRVKALADDLFVLSANSADSLEALKCCLQCYGDLSEAAINWNKSAVFLLEEYRLQVQWGMQRVPKGEAQRFLGVMVALGDSAASQELILREKVYTRIKSWGRAPHLSLMGRGLVITVSAFSLLWFVLRTIKLSEATLKAIRAVARRFLWKPGAEEVQGYIAKVAWEIVCAPREDGGLAITDPRAQNLTLLANWLVKVAEAHDPPDWCLLAEYILMREWALSRPSDVWVTVMIDSFLNKRMKSPFWSNVLQAWRQVKPNFREQPSSKDEVKAQPLFENHLIEGPDGSVFSAAATPGSFSQKWIKRGVATVGDIWDDSTNQWRPSGQLRDKLGRLSAQTERIQMIKQANPVGWIRLLGPEGINPPGTWFRGTQGEEEGKFFRLQNWGEEGNGKCSLEEFSRAEPLSMTIRQTGTMERRGLNSLQEIRVRSSTSPNRHTRPVFSIVAGGTPTGSLRIDPLMWGWESGGQVVKDLSKLEAVKAVRHRRKREKTLSRLIPRWELSQPSVPIPTEEQLVRLWKQLADIPSQKIASLLWLQSHLTVPKSRWLNQRRVQVRMGCDRCSWPVESMTHMWWDCPRSRKWWRWWFAHWEKMSGTSGTKFVQDVAWVLQGFLAQGESRDSGWGYMAQVTRAVMMWVIWLDRNGWRFQTRELSEQQAERLFRTLLKLEIRADWRRKVLQGGGLAGKRWFEKTWARPGALAMIEGDKLRISPWLEG
ncbi:hypothetical protein CBR_g20326 [Chara braunii]|nr:hypothetical protein CBR_g20326 [Chara braunii]|eukprot:GBG75702.1 hypothetical protein CBR_g20326 [Chara braunii]